MFNPNGGNMKDMMEQFGMDFEEIAANRVVIEQSDGDFVFTNVEVNKIRAQGQTMFQIVGEPDEQPEPTPEDAESNDTEESRDTGGTDDTEPYTQDDIELVASRAGVTEALAEEALEDSGGDLAGAIGTLS